VRRGETHVLTQQRAVGDGVFCARLVELERREGGAVAMLLEVLPHERLCDQVRVHAAAPLHCPHRQGAPVAAQSGRTQSGLRCTRERSLARSTPLSVQQRCGASRVSKRAVTKGARVEPYDRVRPGTQQAPAISHVLRGARRGSSCASEGIPPRWRNIAPRDVVAMAAVWAAVHGGAGAEQRVAGGPSGIPDVSFESRHLRYSLLLQPSPHRVHPLQRGPAHGAHFCVRAPPQSRPLAVYSNQD
jgi:hypothetical protein